jgi:hypothetical protein
MEEIAMIQARQIPLRMVAGSFFRIRGGSIWRLEVIDGRRWTVRRLNGVALDEPISTPSDFECWPIAALEVRELVLGTLLNHALETEEGSRDGELNGNDISGACSYSPSHVVRKKSFRRKFIFQKEWITPLIETWSAELIGEFFIRLETLGGYYAARWESFTHPDYHWSSPALSSRSKADERVPERKYIQGSLPDEKKYRDASRFAIIVPHLRLLGDRVVLIKIKTKAANRAVRHAASIALRLCRC